MAVECVASGPFVLNPVSPRALRPPHWLLGGLESLPTAPVLLLLLVFPDWGGPRRKRETMATFASQGARHREEELFGIHAARPSPPPPPRAPGRGSRVWQGSGLQASGGRKRVQVCHTSPALASPANPREALGGPT